MSFEIQKPQPSPSKDLMRMRHPEHARADFIRENKIVIKSFSLSGRESQLH